MELINQTQPLNRNVVGLLCIRAINSNFNSDFTNNPRTNSQGTVIASNWSLQYRMKLYWEQQGKAILGLKSEQRSQPKADKPDEPGSLQARTLEERYTYLTNHVPSAQEKDILLQNLYTFTDIRQFGLTGTFPKAALNIRGHVHIQDGMNIGTDNTIQAWQIGTPFRNLNKEDAAQTTLGCRYFCEEVHYAFGFHIYPYGDTDHKSLGVPADYTEEDYEQFKQACFYAVSSTPTSRTRDCVSEFAIFVRMRNKKNFPNLSHYVAYEPMENPEPFMPTGRMRMGITPIVERFKSDIESIEIYYNPLLIEVEHMDYATYYDIDTLKKLPNRFIS